MAVLGYLPKLKWGLGLPFGAHFLHNFSKKNAPYLTPSQDIKQNVIKVLF